jgi:hypothetical protein
MRSRAFLTSKEDNMSQTKSQRKRQQKKQAKGRNHKRQSNILKNQGPVKYRLDVMIDGSWKTYVREYRSINNVDRHIEETEALRKKGHEIAQGRVINVETGQMVREIAGTASKGMDPKAGDTNSKDTMDAKKAVETKVK